MEIVGAVLLGSMAGWQEGGDCDTCVHEHERWGNNQFCKECKERRKAEKEKTDMAKEARK